MVICVLTKLLRNLKHDELAPVIVYGDSRRGGGSKDRD